MLSLQPHVLEKDPNTRQYKVVRVNPYVRLTNEGNTLYIQSGKVFAETGNEVENPPGWLLEAAERMTPAAKKEVGWTDPPKRPAGR